MTTSIIITLNPKPIPQPTSKLTTRLTPEQLDKNFSELLAHQSMTSMGIR